MPPGSSQTTTSRRAVHHQAYRRRLLWPLLAAPVVLAAGVWRTNASIEDDLTAKTKSVLGTQVVRADFSAQDGTVCVTGDPAAARAALDGIPGAVKLDVRNCPATTNVPGPASVPSDPGGRGTAAATEPPQPTEPRVTEPPQPTEPRATEPRPTEPRPTEPRPTEPSVTTPQTSPVTGSAAPVTETTSPTTSSPTQVESSTPTGGSVVGVPSTTPDSVAAADHLEVALTYDGNTFVLNGSVESDKQRQALVKAATKAASGDETKVTDHLSVVSPATPTAQASQIVTKLGTLIGEVAPTMANAELGFRDRPYLSGTYLDDAAKTKVERAATRADIATNDLKLVARSVPTAAEQSTLVDDLNAMLVAQTITFEPNQAVLTKESATLLDAAAAKLKQFDLTGVNIQIDGYTDTDGTPAGNVFLSQMRANTVRGELVRRGVPADSLTAVGHGSADPIAPNDTPENKAKNRRVTFSVKSS